MSELIGVHGVCRALLINSTHAPDVKRNGLRCGAAASFLSRDKPCCWVHFQADTKGPRAGKVEFWEAKK
jgi:hypothetical protein